MPEIKTLTGDTLQVIRVENETHVHVLKRDGGGYIAFELDEANVEAFRKELDQ